MKDLFTNLSGKGDFVEHSWKEETEPLLPGLGEGRLGFANQEDIRESSAMLREELLALAEAGEIKYSVKAIRKAGQATLEKIKKKYENKIFEETNEFISETLITKFTEFLSSLNLIKDSGCLQKELFKNNLIKRDMKDMVGLVTPLIPSISLLCGAVTVGEHVIKHKFSEGPVPVPSECNEPSRRRDGSDTADGYDTVM